MALLTALDIVNAACLRIGEDPLQDFDEETDGAAAALAAYEEIVDFNLSLSPFSTFAMEVRQLSQDALAVPLAGFTYVYDIPGPRVGPPIWLSDDITDPDRRFTAYRLTANRVNANASPLYAMVKFRPDPHLWTASFKSATITAIAAHFAMSLASDRTLARDLMSEAYGTPQENSRGGKMRAAIFEDSYATPPRKADFGNSPFLRARGAGRFSSDPWGNN